MVSLYYNLYSRIFGVFCFFLINSFVFKLALKVYKFDFGGALSVVYSMLILIVPNIIFPQFFYQNIVLE